MFAAADHRGSLECPAEQAPSFSEDRSLPIAKQEPHKIAQGISRGCRGLSDWRRSQCRSEAVAVAGRFVDSNAVRDCCILVSGRINQWTTIFVSGAKGSLRRLALRLRTLPAERRILTRRSPPIDWIELPRVLRVRGSTGSIRKARRSSQNSYSEPFVPFLNRGDQDPVSRSRRKEVGRGRGTAPAVPLQSSQTTADPVTERSSAYICRGSEPEINQRRLAATKTIVSQYELNRTRCRGRNRL